MKKLMIFLVCVVLCGCATLRKSAIDISIEEVENAKATREVAINYLQIWPIQSGFIKGALGHRMDEFPAQAVEAIKELDQLAANDPNDMVDYELGLSLGLRVRLLGSVVLEALKTYAPDVLELLPLIL